MHVCVCVRERLPDQNHCDCGAAAGKRKTLLGLLSVGNQVVMHVPFCSGHKNVVVGSFCKESPLG